MRIRLFCHVCFPRERGRRNRTQLVAAGLELQERAELDVDLGILDIYMGVKFMG